MAREKGLEPLAQMLLAQEGADPLQAAQAFIDPEKGVPTAEEALEGARHILAEIINEDGEITGVRREGFFSVVREDNKAVLGVVEPFSTPGPLSRNTVW